MLPRKLHRQIIVCLLGAWLATLAINLYQLRDTSRMDQASLLGARHLGRRECPIAYARTCTEVVLLYRGTQYRGFFRAPHAFYNEDFAPGRTVTWRWKQATEGLLFYPDAFWGKWGMTVFVGAFAAGMYVLIRLRLR